MPQPQFLTYDAVKSQATIEDTLKLIVRFVNEAQESDFVKLMVTKLQPGVGTRDEFLHRLFDTVCANVKYKLDEDPHECVWTPSLTIANGVGDCKKMATLIASVLKAAGIEPILKHIYYKDKDYTHIFVIVQKGSTLSNLPKRSEYIVLDPVNNCQYDTEIAYDKGSLNFLNGNQMELHAMGRGSDAKRTGRSYGFSSDMLQRPTFQIDQDLSQISGVGVIVKTSGLFSGIAKKIHDASNSIKSAASKAVNTVEHAVSTIANNFKGVAIAIPRGAFLGLVRLNVLQLADRLAHAIVTDGAKMQKTWEDLGGDYNILKQTVKEGTKSAEGGQIKGMGVVANRGMDLQTFLKLPGLYHPNDLTNKNIIYTKNHPHYTPANHPKVHPLSRIPALAHLSSINQVHPNLQALRTTSGVTMGQAVAASAALATAAPILAMIMKYLESVKGAINPAEHPLLADALNVAVNSAEKMTAQELGAHPPDTSGKNFKLTPAHFGVKGKGGKGGKGGAPTAGSFGITAINSPSDLIGVLIKMPIYLTCASMLGPTYGPPVAWSMVIGTIIYFSRNSIKRLLNK